MEGKRPANYQEILSAQAFHGARSSRLLTDTEHDNCFCVPPRKDVLWKVTYYTPAGFLRYLVKSGIFVAIVAHPPVILDMLESINQERVLPDTVYLCHTVSLNDMELSLLRRDSLRPISLCWLLAIAPLFSG